MSHFTCIQTQITHIDSLVKALADAGFATVEVYPTPQHLYGFQGEIRPETAEVIIRRRYIGPMSNDIGFKRQENGTFKAIISDYDRLQYPQAWIDRLTQRYAYHVLITAAPTAGFTLEVEEVLPDGTIRVVLGRWT